LEVLQNQFSPEEGTMEIQVEVKSIYGQEKIYPLCLAGETFAEIAGTKTLTTETIALAKRLGYQFIVKPREI
jgi:hypothetical protein